MDLATALSFSRYATAALATGHELREWLVAALDTPMAWCDGFAPDDSGAPPSADALTLSRELRVLRRRAFLHTMARDLTGRADLAEVVDAMTRLAERAIGRAVAFHQDALEQQHGPVQDRHGTTQDLIVVAMGKLGGAELNVSSDVDLVFLYPEDGESTGTRRLAAAEFFERAGRRVIAALADATADGYVFRVDTRLRPYGDSGPLALSMASLEEYLQTQGRIWERYAWLKARIVGVARPSRDFPAVVVPFVYRKYLDYDVYEGLRDVHRQIREAAARRGKDLDVKLGPGGIRELEFIVQALQIVRGGREPSLRQRGTRPALAALGVRGLLPAAVARDLDAAYVFLRTVEHRLQYRDDRQTHAIPGHPEERAQIAASLEFASLAHFDLALATHRDAVSAQFMSFFGVPGRTAIAPEGRAPGEAPETDGLATIWSDDPDRAALVAALAAGGLTDPDAMIDLLARIRRGARYLRLPGQSRERFDALVPQLLDVAIEQRAADADPQTVFVRMLGLLESVASRSAYLALLTEHPRLLPRLAQLMGASAWAADYLTQHPLLLDDLIDPRMLFVAPEQEQWKSELGARLAGHAPDVERQMDDLRHFQHAQTLKLLAQDLAGSLRLERLADHLSALADTILEATHEAVWAQLPEARGAEPRFAIIGYGKLGGKELGYASDLDLVFLYDDDGADDDEATAAAVRYSRHAQRMVTWLTSTTGAGRLYDVDLRLRPDGAAGLIVLPIAAFRRYQREQAQTWEHQALCRARFVAGDAGLGAAFEELRLAILSRPRDAERLRDDVEAMRARMHAGHPNPTERFDLKHDPGGMVDIEFIVQFLVLANGSREPALLRNVGNIALLGLAAELGLAPAALCAAVADSYREFRRLQHRVRLTGALHARVDPSPQAARRSEVASLWRHVFGAREAPAARGPHA